MPFKYDIFGNYLFLYKRVIDGFIGLSDNPLGKVPAIQYLDKEVIRWVRQSTFVELVEFYYGFS